MESRRIGCAAITIGVCCPVACQSCGFARTRCIQRSSSAQSYSPGGRNFKTEVGRSLPVSPSTSEDSGLGGQRVNSLWRVAHSDVRVAHKQRFRPINTGLFLIPRADSKSGAVYPVRVRFPPPSLLHIRFYDANAGRFRGGAHLPGLFEICLVASRDGLKHRARPRATLRARQPLAHLPVLEPPMRQRSTRESHRVERERSARSWCSTPSTLPAIAQPSGASSPGGSPALSSSNSTLTSVAPPCGSNQKVVSMRTPAL